MVPVQEFTKEEVAKKNSREELWVTVEDGVYDLTKWVKRHPGGSRVIRQYGGEDVTDPFMAFHTDLALAKKHLAVYRVGTLVDYEPLPVQEDFRKLRKEIEAEGLFTPSPWFYTWNLGHILLLEVLAVAVFSYFGTGWGPYILAASLCATAQSQAGWLQHDFGHLSVFKDRMWNHYAHRFVIGFLKGASSEWWNHRHFLHHSKPNCTKMDPDVNLPYVFMLGRTLPQEWGKKKKGFMPYHLQHHYFHILGPALLLNTYFHYENIHFVITRRHWIDLACMVGFFVRHNLMFAPYLGVGGAFMFYFFIRFLESHWFVWVTQMSHLTKEVNRDQKRNWVDIQLHSTCNVDPSAFNDWFSGHLNFQIEHHLFPTMPRHNYAKVMQRTRALCKRHNLFYESKPLLTAFGDILTSLADYGQLYRDAYLEG